MDKQDEERIRKIVREEIQRWYVENVIKPKCLIYFETMGSHDKVGVHESESILHNQS